MGSESEVIYTVIGILKLSAEAPDIWVIFGLELFWKF